MPTDTRSQSPASSGSRPDTRAVILGTIADITWRMMLPTLIGLFGGMAIDSMLSSSPIGFLAGAVVGFAIGVMSAFRLLKKAQELSR